jgi:kynurenine--oxoglutarate transaminase/cysteine-S-conjugate beta-lyase/glutamine--phenylpyruvate transaminase
VVGRRELISDIQTALPYVQFCASTPMQEAIATVIRRADQPYEGFPTYYDWLANVFSQKRDQLAASLKEAGIKTMEAQGGFFLLADTSDVHVPEKYLREGAASVQISLFGCRIVWG